MHQLTVIGLGAGELDQLPLGIYRKLKEAGEIYVRTADHPVLAELETEGLRVRTFDPVYEKHDSFPPVYREIADELIGFASGGPVVYAVPGHPLVAEQTVRHLIEAEEEGRVRLVIEGGQSFLDPVFSALRIDPIDGFQLVDGTSFGPDDVNMAQHVLIAQVYDQFSASDAKLSLMEKYEDDHPVTIVTAAGSSRERLVTVPLYELDRTVETDNLTTVYVPPVSGLESRLKEWGAYREIIRTLRGPDGCPWDRKQTHESLKKYMIEEAHELLEAIDSEDDEAIIAELGDVLLQVFLHAQIGEDAGFFSVEDVLKSAGEKMIRRHPHVFGEANAEDADEVVRNWQAIKEAEKGEKPASLLDGQNRHASSLLTSFNYQKEAAKAGFSWPDAGGAKEKFEEEWQEFLDASANGDEEALTDEFGDVLFTLVNIARYYGISPEEAMTAANRKFKRRFSHVEERVAENRGSFGSYTLNELDRFWDEAKRMERDR
ncbi:nucleoside triphosphate pyrophosphohydrolase [Bhargavaea cecembensis]|uniref:nucleoside triphosphate pyrophosphohydrolase n=1 Tax=Bhargavaea cecembensis TaxID=394098 RepID=UPI00058DB187|nr:nucleoside triphosphate pyrophosphohydrolase [Bhargavaea cecembensis]